MIRITAPHFVAGLEIKDRIVVRAAPIIRYMVGWPIGTVKDYCDKKGWKFEVTHD
ncbi:MAG: hypothetical protein HQK77_14225 [Desulfobacterales bacterium]|nr:hypothetical protein [Desulfobacterales bacterium]